MNRLKINEKIDLVKVFLIILAVVLAGISGLFYYQITEWELAFERFRVSYSNLQNRTSSLESYYNDLQDMYSSLRSEYSDLQKRYSDLEKKIRVLQNEYDEVLRLEKIVVLEKDKILNLTVKGNTTLSYETIFAGYIEVNFTASVDIYFWIGSSLTQDKYYARYPPFPDTALNGTFITPVCSTVFIHIANPNELMEATVTLSIKYIY